MVFVALAATGLGACRGSDASPIAASTPPGGEAPAGAASFASTTPSDGPTTTSLPPGSVRTATGAGNAPRDDRIGPPGNGRPAVPELTEGVCFNDVIVGTEGTIAHVLPVVGCSTPHDAEVFATLMIDAAPGAGYPGDRDLGRFTSSSCLARFEPYVGRDYATSVLRIAVLRPTLTSWAAGDRRIACSLYHQDLEPLVDSAARSGR